MSTSNGLNKFKSWVQRWSLTPPHPLTLAELPNYLRNNHFAILKQWNAGGDLFSWIENHHGGRAKAQVRT